jgi:hypothetical protein
MSRNTNAGSNALTVYGNPQSFKSLINNHGQLCKVKQALVCPCVAGNHGSPDGNCEICGGKGHLYTYQRRMLVSDEDTPISYDGSELRPFWVPLLEVVKVQRVSSPVQGGITNLTVKEFTEEVITLETPIVKYDKKRVSYYFDGWTYVASEKLRVDVAHKLMYADGTIYQAGYQSSNPLNAFADIAKIEKIWNADTGAELTSYTYEGNTIATTQTVSDNMYIEYYYADLSQVITTDLNNKDQNEVYIHDLKSGECKMAFYPFLELAKGDIIVLPATTLYKNELLIHRKDLDRLHEIEIFALHDNIVDETGKTYYIGTDYILQGNHVKWVGSKPVDGKAINVRYGFKPAYIIFDDNPQPNNLENKQYPVLVLAKSWSKTSPDEVTKLMAGL